MKHFQYLIFLLLTLFIAFNSCMNMEYSQGKSLYLKNCANCHGNSGEGLADLMPPLANSDYVKNNLYKISCIIKYGLEGPIEVNGKSYQQAMPAMKNLSEIEIVNLVNYIAKDLNRIENYTSLSDVENQLKNCNQR